MSDGRLALPDQRNFYRYKPDVEFHEYQARGDAQTALRQAGRHRGCAASNQMFQFRCDCGNNVVRAVSAVKRSKMASCGCYRRNPTAHGYTGVIKNKRKYQSQIKRNGRKIYLGSFATAAEAAAAYQRAKADSSYQPPVRLKGNATGYTGIYAQGRKFRAAIWRNGRKIHLGVFTTAAEASAAYQRAKAQAT